MSADYATSDTVEMSCLGLLEILIPFNGNDFDAQRSFLLLPASPKGRLKN